MAIRRVFSADFVELQKLEILIEGIKFIPNDKRNKLLIVCSEIFDNILTHSDRLLARRVYFSVRHRKGLTAVFLFKAGNFRRFAEAGGKPVGVHYDAASGRHRGLGLIMSSNLAKSIRFRSGRLLDSVILKL